MELPLPCRAWLRIPGSLGSPLGSPRPADVPFFLLPTDGLVKRLEELERTAELYKGRQRTSGGRPVVGGGVPVQEGLALALPWGAALVTCTKDRSHGGRNVSLQNSRTVAIKNS